MSWNLLRYTQASPNTKVINKYIHTQNYLTKKIMYNNLLKDLSFRQYFLTNEPLWEIFIFLMNYS